MDLSQTKLLTDHPLSDLNKDSLNFIRYAEKLTSIIQNSTSPICSGIFGDWGTGKTSLMKIMESKLDEEPKHSHGI